MFFPRYVDPEPATEPPKPRKPWTVDEMLPPFAWFERTTMTTEQAASLVEHFESLPAWAQSVAPIDEARRITS